MFSKVNILQELEVQENKIQKGLLASTRTMLKSLEEKDNNIRKRIRNNSSSHEGNTDCNLLQDEKLFSIQTIRKICMRYRLRFLDSKYFKSEIPQEAVYKIRTIEEKYGVKLSGFRVIAPDEMFNLENREKDPVLLADAGNGQYIFIHKWGGEFNWWRKLVSTPLQSIETVLATNLLFSFLTAALYSFYVYTIDPFYVDTIFVVFVTFAFFIGYGCLLTFSMFTFKIHPTQMIWKSRFID